jgi:5'-3' exonuclease
MIIIELNRLYKKIKLIMGIKHLNRFLRDFCKKSIRPMHFHELAGKTVVIDTNNYLYRFLGENTLLENFYLMISLFRYYNITPIFVFDGKAPQEKKEILQIRREKKYYARKEYNKLKAKLKDTVTAQEHDEILSNMTVMKKKFTQVRLNDIKLVKMLMMNYGVNYIDAEGEADALCAKLVVKKIAYACISEDMDMFVYGCPRVLRYLSLIHSTVICYEYKGILSELNLNTKEFREICVISGTDYNYETAKNTSLINTLKHFKKYKKSKSNIDFYDWLEENTNYIQDEIILYSTLSMFDLKYAEIPKNLLRNNVCNKVKNNIMLREILKKEDFIFV